MRERSAPSQIPSLDNFNVLNDDPITFLEAPSSSNGEFSSRMANIFDESDEETIIAEKSSEPVASRQLFTATVFLSIPNVLHSMKFGLVLVKNNEKTNIILYDSSKKNVIHTSINETKFELDEVKRTAKFESTIGETNQDLTITFIDSSELQRFAILVLLHSPTNDPSTSSYYILNRGTGDLIEIDCSVLYDKVKHKIDEDGEMSLPFVQNNIKSKLTAEKITGHALHSIFIGLSKGANILLKSSENTVSQVTIRKVKYPTDKKETTPLKPETESQETPIETEPTQPDKLDLKERMAKIGRSVVPLPQSQAKGESPSTASPEENVKESEVLVEEHEETPIIIPDKSTNLTNTDIYEILHRVVGVEVDRMNLKLDAKFDAFRTEVLTRLDRQNELLERLLIEKEAKN